MKINAYILVADPAWIEPSILSFYDRVERIVVSYDADALGWTGTPVDLTQCFERLHAIDRDNKLDMQPGHFARAEFFDRPQQNELHQRRVCLADAGRDADWVLQLDTDEVIGDTDKFFACVDRADKAGAEGLEYPARWLYKRIFGDWYLEQCRRGGRVAAGYPGAMAIRSGVALRLARQGPTRLYRVDFGLTNTDPSHPRDAVVDEAVTLQQGISHYSWTRSDAEMLAKSLNSPHACDFDWKPLLAKWQRSHRWPIWTSLRSQLERGNWKKHVRPARVTMPESLRRQLPAGFDFATGGIHPVVVPATSGSAPAPSAARKAVMT